MPTLLPVTRRIDLADELAVGRRVVAVLRARLPLRRLRARARRSPAPTRALLRASSRRRPTRGRPGATAGTTPGSSSLPACRELGPVLRDRRVDVERALLRELVRADRGRRPSWSRTRATIVSSSHGAAGRRRRRRRPRGRRPSRRGGTRVNAAPTSRPVGEVLLERVAHAFESGCGEPLATPSWTHRRAGRRLRAHGRSPTSNTASSTSTRRARTPTTR